MAFGSSQANIKAVITAEDRASKVLNGFANNVSNVAKKAAIGIAAASAAAVGFGVASVKAYTESENAIAQTNAVLKSTGNIAGITAKQVTQLATSLQKTTTFSDEEVRSAENLLLTFTKIGKDIFPQATKTVLNMATALGEDTKSASIQLGKALQDPILGITALRRVGVNFNDEQKKVIQNLVETGQQAKAQQLILKELQIEFGGSAEAAGNTFAGSLKRLKNNINDLQEAIGLVIINALQPFTQAAANFVNSIDWQKVINNTTSAIKDLWQSYIVPFTQAVIDLATRFYNFLLPSLTALWNVIQSQLIPSLSNLWHNVIQPLIPVIGTILAAAIWTAINVLNVLIQVISAVIGWLSKYRTFVMGVVSALVVWYTTMKIAAGFNALYNFIALANAKLGAMLVQTNGVRGALLLLNRSMAGFTGFGILAGAATIAAVAIVNAANRAKAAWLNTMAAISQASASDDEVLRRLQYLKAHGTAEQQQRATITLQKLAAEGAFAEGGFTGVGAPNQIAGIVHKGEYVIPHQFVDQNTGTPNLGGSSVINFAVNIGMFAGTPIERKNIAKTLFRDFQDAARQFGINPTALLDGTNGVRIR